MNTAVTSAERTAPTQHLARTAHKHGTANKGGPINLFADALTAANNTSASEASALTDKESASPTQPKETPPLEGLVAAALPLTTTPLTPLTHPPETKGTERATPAVGLHAPTEMTATKALPESPNSEGMVPNPALAEGPQAIRPTTHAEKNKGTDTDALPSVGKAVAAAAKTAGRNLPPPQVLMQVMGLDPSAAQAWHMSTPGEPAGRLVAQTQANETTPQDTALPVSSDAITSPARSTDQSATGSQDGAPSMATDSAQSDNLTEPSPAAGSDTPFAQSLSEAMGDAFHQLDTQVSFWMGQNVRRASINLDLGTDQPLQVDVSLDGESAQLDFRTNDPEARAALQNHAEPVLNELLARNGLGLSGFSVGTQSHSGTSGDERSGRNSTQAFAQRSAAVNEAEPAVVQRWTQRSANGLDIYA